MVKTDRKILPPPTATTLGKGDKGDDIRQTNGDFMPLIPQYGFAIE